MLVIEREIALHRPRTNSFFFLKSEHDPLLPWTRCQRTQQVISVLQCKNKSDVNFNVIKGFWFLVFFAKLSWWNFHSQEKSQLIHKVHLLTINTSMNCIHMSYFLKPCHVNQKGPVSEVVRPKPPKTLVAYIYRDITDLSWRDSISEKLYF